ncbi:MAG: hypothetical protein Q9163_005412 [Psora crenata]
MNFAELNSSPAYNPLKELDPIQYAYETLQDLQNHKSTTNITDLFEITKVLNHASYALLVDLSAKKRRQAAITRQAKLDQSKESTKATIKGTLLLVGNGVTREALADQAGAVNKAVELCNKEQSSIDQEQEDVYNILAANSREVFANADINHAFHLLSDMSSGSATNEDAESQRRANQCWWAVSDINHITGQMLIAMEGECQRFLENLATLLWHSRLKISTHGERRNRNGIPQGLIEALNELDGLLRMDYGIDFLECKLTDNYLSQIRHFWRMWAGWGGKMFVDIEAIWEFVAESTFSME